ncbi:LPS-assembly lipoprotein [Pseudidiomarina indica]|uniref:LPS-assembly lipoprotein LptE n=1 Tax=Pseudidiomarina indica TaxID=1159017 RepID=A0A1G6C4G8_9GAMM|nr:LPS assembly lipoprotein LptE [Pseudidiomarina indica]SDB27724.1 LPS-assembly lipoprotein [Pseudidiomarina indica]
MQRMSRWIIVTLIAAAVSSCGFQLRDHYQLPPAMESVAIKAPAFSEFAKVVEQRFTLAGVNLANLDTETLVIELLNEQLDRRTLSLSQSGQVAEYEMIYTVTYQLLKQGEASAVQKLEVYRDYQDDPNFALAKTREREVLVQEMRQEAAHQLLRQTIALLTE